MSQMIGVLMGGNSPERDVSLLSGKGVFESLERSGYAAKMISIELLDDLVPSLEGITAAFSCLHGGAGEDGTVQMLLDVMGIPYIGSGPLASGRAMNKSKAKSFFRSQHLPTPQDVIITADNVNESVQEAIETLPFPLIAKPQAGGSTIAVHQVIDPSTLLPVVSSILSNYETVLVEPFIEGRELTVGILQVDGEEIALPVIEIQFQSSLFDYEAKYTDGEAEFLAPAPLDPGLAHQVQELGLKAHQALGCFGFSRVDFRLSTEGTPYLLEVNTLPGMTPLSDLPRAAALVGIDYDSLVKLMLETAFIDNR